MPVGHSLTIIGVGRDCRGIRITYEIRPPLVSLGDRPHVEARDDCDDEYGGIGGSIGLAGSQDCTITLGSFTVRFDSHTLRCCGCASAGRMARVHCGSAPRTKCASCSERYFPSRLRNLYAADPDLYGIITPAGLR